MQCFNTQHLLYTWQIPTC